MDNRIEKELSTRRTVLIFETLEKLRKDIHYNAQNEELKEAYRNLEDAISKVLDAEKEEPKEFIVPTEILLDGNELTKQVIEKIKNETRFNTNKGVII